MRTLDENTITDAVMEQISGTPNPRFKQIMGAAVRHLHEFAREVNLTPQEWLEGIRFFTEVGQKCTPYRQEFILLSDTLGLSALVGLISDSRIPDVHTDTSLLGTFLSAEFAAGGTWAVDCEEDEREGNCFVGTSEGWERTRDSTRVDRGVADG